MKRSTLNLDSRVFSCVVNVVLGLYGHRDLAADALQPPPPDGQGSAGQVPFRGVTIAINVLSEDATLLGATPQGIASSTFKTAKLANSVVFGNTMLGEAVINYDQWDGYPAERDRFLDFVDDAGMDNLVVLSGDVHVSLAVELHRAPFDATDREPAIEVGLVQGGLVLESDAEQLTTLGSLFYEEMPCAGYDPQRRPALVSALTACTRRCAAPSALPAGRSSPNRWRAAR